MIVVVGGLISLLLTGLFIQLARRYGWGKAVRRDGPRSHLAKEGTPTMGGVAVLLAAVAAWLLFGGGGGDELAVLLLALAAGLLGWLDDVSSLRRKRRRADGDADAATGLLARYRIALQALVALAFAGYAVVSGHPLFGLAWLDVLAYAFVVVGTVNAVNFSDGLDGLAGGMMVIMLLPFVGLNLAGALLGALLGFLWYNTQPARVFMGGVGAEALGAALAGVAILSGWTWWLPLIAIIPVLEVLSVVVQVSYFRATGGKRLFKMSPLHHHFELSGWSETQVVARFWLVTAAAVALAWGIRAGQL